MPGATVCDVATPSSGRFNTESFLNGGQPAALDGLAPRLDGRINRVIERTQPPVRTERLIADSRDHQHIARARCRDIRDPNPFRALAFLLLCAPAGQIHGRPSADANRGQTPVVIDVT